MAPRPQLHKPSPDTPSPPSRRAGVPPPANDNRARRLALSFAAGAVVFTAIVVLASRLLG